MYFPLLFVVLRSCIAIVLLVIYCEYTYHYLLLCMLRIAIHFTGLINSTPSTILLERVDYERFSLKLTMQSEADILPTF